MRRTSLTPAAAKSLGTVLHAARTNHGLSVRALVAASGVNIASILKLEDGGILAPQVDTLRALADVLDIPMSDIFAVAGWLPEGELPALRPYLRAKYRDLDDDAITDLERYAQQLAKRAGTSGPRDREDETPD